MIKKLKRRLIFLFICVTMSIFTCVFGLLLDNSISSSQANGMIFFGREASYILFQLEESQTMERDLENLEDSSEFLFQLTDANGGFLYQSESLRQDPGPSAVLSEELKKTDVIDLDDSKVVQSGTFSFSVPAGESYYAVQARIKTNSHTFYTLDIFKKVPSYFEMLGEDAPFYLLIWFLVLAAVSLLAILLIGRAVSPAERAVKSQKEFIAAASHELKSPLAVILALSESIESDLSLSPETRRQARTIDSECIRMSKLIQDMLLLSSVDANSWKLKKSRVDIDTLLIHVFEKYEPLCRQKGQHFFFDMSDDIFPEIDADADRLEQILGILIDNASHYSPENSEVRLWAAMDAHHVVFSVIDNGPGIADEDKPFIYDRFFCADKSRTERDHFGLGLCIAKELAKMHGGTIRLSDTPGGGCTFAVVLPLNR